MPTVTLLETTDFKGLIASLPGILIVTLPDEEFTVAEAIASLTERKQPIRMLGDKEGG